MSEVIELSSDDDNCCSSVKLKDINKYDSDTTDDTDIDSLLNKYRNVDCDKYDYKEKKSESIASNSSNSHIDDDDLQSLKEKLRRKYDTDNDLLHNIDIGIQENNMTKDFKIDYKAKTMESISSSSSENETDDISLLKHKLNQKYNAESLYVGNECFFENDIQENIDLNNLQNNEEPKAKRPRNKKENKNQNKIEKDQEKARKQVERERVKAETAKAKAEKQRLASVFKNLKPDECIKFITVLIDSDLMSMECSTDIPNILQNANISYKVTSNLLPCTIVWNRKVEAQLTNINGELQINRSEENSNQVLLIMIWKDFAYLVHGNKLTSEFKLKQSILVGKKISLGIYGLENYFRFHKSQKQKIPGKERIYVDTPKISRKDADMALIELQLLFNVSHRYLETPQDISAMVLQFTKSISQVPYKLQKELKAQQNDWYISGDNKDCVRVDKNGNGLHRLWQQQLTQFTLVRLEIAEAITSKYPSPSSLIKAYDQCSTRDGEKLLQDIPIRRAAGPLTSVRKIGPELSKKTYTLFTSIDGDVYL